MDCSDRPEVHALSNMGSLLAQSPWGFQDPPAPAKLQNNESVTAKPKPGVKNLWNVTQSLRPPRTISDGLSSEVSKRSALRGCALHSPCDLSPRLLALVWRATKSCHMSTRQPGTT